MCAGSHPSAAKDLPLVINWHSVKNRFLMRGKNASAWLCWRLFLPVVWRDLMTFGYAIVARSAVAVGGDLLVEGARQHSSQACHYPGAPPRF